MQHCHCWCNQLLYQACPSYLGRMTPTRLALDTEIDTHFMDIDTRLTPTASGGLTNSPKEEDDNDDGAARGIISPTVAGTDNNEDDLDNSVDRDLWDRRKGLCARCAHVEII